MSAEISSQDLEVLAPKEGSSSRVERTNCEDYAIEVKMGEECDLGGDLYRMKMRTQKS